MTLNEAVKEACDILRDEANELACLQTGNDHYKLLPRRAQIAIRREMVRLREIQTTLEHSEEAA